MGYLFLFALCEACRRAFGSNPYLVPVIVVNGDRRPVCRSCAEILNAERIKMELEPVPILPDAYHPVHDGYGDDAPFDL